MKEYPGEGNDGLCWRENWPMDLVRKVMVTLAGSSSVPVVGVGRQKLGWSRLKREWGKTDWSKDSSKFVVLQRKGMRQLLVGNWGKEVFFVCFFFFNLLWRISTICKSSYHWISKNSWQYHFICYPHSLPSLPYEFEVHLRLIISSVNIIFPMRWGLKKDNPITIYQS